MISLTVLFWIFILQFAVIGALRGWAKEILATFSIVLAMFLVIVLETYVGPVRSTLASMGGTSHFWMRALVLLGLAFFGYQTPNIRAIAGARFARERLQDVLLGFLLGGLNGYLIVGTIWYYLHQAGYPFEIISPPRPGDPFFDSAARLITALPPTFLDVPFIFIAVGLSFLFVIIVFI